MNSKWKRKQNFVVAFIFLTLLMAASVQAHLMVAQHGTLKLQDNAVFMVVSLPISAFSEIDDNGDGLISLYEFNRNRDTVQQRVDASVFLTDEEGRIKLEGTMLSPVTPHEGSSEWITDLVVLGRFNLRTADSQFRFACGLYGDEEPQQTLNMSVRNASSGQQSEFTLTPASPERVVPIQF